ncbi:MAG: C4-type zinc ribbon domain-containing protein [bacterium]
MKETIELLKALQEKDTSLDEVSKIIIDLPRIIKEEEEEINTLKNGFEKKRGNLLELQKEFRHKERELNGYEDKIKGFKSHFYEIKTKKELDALEEEIKKIGDLKEKIEQDCLLLMDTIEAKEREVNNEEREISAKEIAFKNKKEEREKVLKEAEERQKILIASRDEIAGKIDKRILELYETIRKNKDNIALARVLNNTCTVCQMGLRPQIINEIKEGNNIIRCESCLRILYI